MTHTIAGFLPDKTLDTGGRAQQLCDGVEGDLAGVRLAEGAERVHATGGRHRRNFAHETTFADAG